MPDVRKILGFRQPRPVWAVVCLVALGVLQFALIHSRHEFFERSSPLAFSLTVAAVLFSVGGLTVVGLAGAYSRQRSEPVGLLRFLELYVMTSVLCIAPVGILNLWLMSQALAPIDSLGLVAKLIQLTVFAALAVHESHASPLKRASRIYG